MPQNYSKGDEPVPGYRLVGLLGRGGFGEVWKATSPGGIPVAIKVISLSARHGFKELRAIQRVKLIRHPNLIPITAFWLKDQAGKILDEAQVDTEFRETPKSAPAQTDLTTTREARIQAAELIIAMTLGDKSLFERLDECIQAGQPAIPHEELLGYMEEAAKAIDFLNATKHDLGQGLVSIQHCDIKPQNIMIVGGSAAICDFGLARVLGEVRVSETPASFAYAAPEYLQLSTPSSNTDQYSLAISYVELRTGQLPFDNETFLIVMNQKIEGKLNLSKLTEAEQAVITRAASIEPGSRYSSTQEMVRELRKATQDGTAIPKPRPKRSSSELVQSDSEIVPGYRLIKLLGRGGFGEVWEATAPGGRHVALKIIRNLGGARGKREYKALELIKSVDHQHLLELHAYWLLDSDGYVITDEQRERPDAPAADTLVIATRLATKNLWQRLQECRANNLPGITLDELLPYMHQTASAIDYLNAERHIIKDTAGDERAVAIQHRDIKPENLLLVGENTLNVGDFGLAKVLEGTSAEVHAGSRGLTLYYAAPEAFEGRVTKWTDQYSLAITYFQLRTGLLPFETTSPTEVMEAHRTGKLDFSRLSELEREVIGRATATEPAQRFDSCTDMAFALEQACGVEASDVASTRTTRSGKPRPGQAIPKRSSSLPPFPTVGESGKPPSSPIDVTLDRITPSDPPVLHTQPYQMRTAAGDEVASDTDKPPGTLSRRGAISDRETIDDAKAAEVGRKRRLMRIQISIMIAFVACAMIWAGQVYFRGGRSQQTAGGGTELEAPEGFREAVDRGDFQEALRLASLDEDHARLTGLLKVELRSAVTKSINAKDFPAAVAQIMWSRSLDSDLQSKLLDDLNAKATAANGANDFETALAICDAVLEEFPNDKPSTELKQTVEAGVFGRLRRKIEDATKRLASDPKAANLEFESVLSGLKQSDDSRLRKSAVLGSLRSRARLAPPAWAEIQSQLQQEFGDAAKRQTMNLSKQNQAILLVLEARAIVPQPQTATEQQLESALSLLNPPWEDQSLLDVLDPNDWEAAQVTSLLDATLARIASASPAQIAKIAKQALAIKPSLSKASLMLAGAAAKLQNWDEAAEAYRKLLEQGDARDDALQGLADVAIGKGSRELFGTVLAHFADHRAEVAGNKILLARLAELHAQWVQRRIADLKTPAEFQAMLKEIEREEKFPEEAQGGWLKACKAEALVEASSRKPGAEDRKLAQKLVEPALEDAGGYSHYVRALVWSCERDGVAKAAGELLHCVADKPDAIFAASSMRRDRALAMLSDAAADTRTERALQPFRSTEAAKSAFEWLDAAARLGSKPEQLSVAARANLALAAWYKADEQGKPNAELALRLSEQLLGAGGDALGGSQLPVLIVNALAQPDAAAGHAQAIRRFGEALKQVTAKPAAQQSAPDVYRAIVSPAVARIKKLAPQLDPVRKEAAMLYAQKGRLILGNLPSFQSLDDATREALESLDEAVALDGSMAVDLYSEVAEQFGSQATSLLVKSQEDLGAKLQLYNRAIDWTDGIVPRWPDGKTQLAKFQDEKATLLRRYLDNPELLRGVSDPLEQTRKLYLAAIANQPAETRYRIHLGHLYATKYSPPKADEITKVIREILEIDANNVGAIALQGWLVQQQARKSKNREDIRRLENEAIDHFSRAIKNLPADLVSPDDAYVFTYRTASYTYLGQHLDLTAPSKAYYLGKESLKEAQLQYSRLALEDAKRATAVPNPSGVALRAMGNAYEDVAALEGNKTLLQDARNAFENSSIANPPDLDSEINIGRVVLRLAALSKGEEQKQALSEAEQILSKVLTERSNDTEACYHLAQVFKSQGKTPEAVKVLRGAVERGEVVSLYWRECVLDLFGIWSQPTTKPQPSELQEYLRWTAELQADASRAFAAYLLAGKSRELAGQVEQAAQAYSDGIKKAPKEPVLRIALGYLHHAKKEYEAARQQAERAVLDAESDRELRAAYDLLAGALDGLKLHQEWIDAVEKKVELLADPEVAAQSLYQIAKRYQFILKRPEPAINAITRAISTTVELKNRTDWEVEKKKWQSQK